MILVLLLFYSDNIHALVSCQRSKSCPPPASGQSHGERHCTESSNSFHSMSHYPVCHHYLLVETDITVTCVCVFIHNHISIYVLSQYSEHSNINDIQPICSSANVSVVHLSYGLLTIQDNTCAKYLFHGVSQHTSHSLQYILYPYFLEITLLLARTPTNQQVRKRLHIIS